MSVHEIRLIRFDFRESNCIAESVRNRSQRDSLIYGKDAVPPDAKYRCLGLINHPRSHVGSVIERILLQAVGLAGPILRFRRSHVNGNSLFNDVRLNGIGDVEINAVRDIGLLDKRENASLSRPLPKVTRPQTKGRRKLLVDICVHVQGQAHRVAEQLRNAELGTRAAS